MPTVRGRDRRHRWPHSAHGAEDEARLRFLLTAGPVVIYACDIATEDYPATHVSPNIETMIGYSAAEFLADRDFWKKHVHPDDLPAVRAIHRHILRHGRLVQEYRFRHKDGAWLWTRDEQVVIHDAAASPKK